MRRKLQFKTNQMIEDDVIQFQGRGCLLKFIFIVIKTNHTKSHSTQN